MARPMAFGNRSLSIHVVRGAIGLGALIIALKGYDIVGWPALLLIGVSVWALKGCPICWTIGLFETLAAKVFMAVDPGVDQLAVSAPLPRAPSSAHLDLD